NGGNCFTFVQNFKKCSFPEAVIEVAEIIGKPLNIEYTAPKKENRYQPLYDLLKDYIEYTNYLLTATRLGLEAKEYLAGRGIDEDIINEFSIGYCPEDNKVYQNLKARNYSDEDMIRTNIARLGNNGMNDVFYKRITFPIHNREGNPVAFTARDFSGFSDSKYINSSETVIYTKGNILYNQHRAKDSARQNGTVIVCEGVMDVIAYKRAGISNAVATLGTACTREQISLLHELAKTVVLSYDGDRAGKAANMKIGELLLENGLNVEVIDNDTGLDPDEIITRHGKNALRDLSSKRLSYIDYAIKYYKDIYNLENYSDRKAMTIKVSALIDKLPDAYDRENYGNELYDLTRIRKRDKGNASGNNDKRVSRHHELSLDGLTKAEYTILSMMSISEAAKDIYQKDLGYLLDEEDNQLANLIIDEYRRSDNCQLSRMYDEVKDEGLKNLILSLGTIETLPDTYDENVLKGAINRIKEEIKKRKLSDLKKEIGKYQTIDPVKTNQYLEEYTQLLKELGEK
ncbi:MAG: DNA primase, partial [Erysipelotrichaceae bacterium]|nr:DNA primase [Erysipelotrichaceae bacterium]